MQAPPAAPIESWQAHAPADGADWDAPAHAPHQPSHPSSGDTSYQSTYEDPAEDQENSYTNGHSEDYSSQTGGYYRRSAPPRQAAEPGALPAFSRLV